MVSVPVASLAMSAVGLTILVLGVIRETERLEAVDRLLVFVAALGFLPVTYELITGQVTMLIAAAVYPVRERDGYARGIALGLALAPVREAAVPAAAAVDARVAPAGAAGHDRDGRRRHARGRGPPRDRHLPPVGGRARRDRADRPPGNLALTALGNPVVAVPLAIAAAAVALWAIIRDDRRGFVAALLVALLVAPFTLMYQVSILLLAVRPALAVAPSATRVLALIANPAVLVAFVPWTGAGLLAIAPWRRRDEP